MINIENLFHPISKEMSNGMRMPGKEKLSVEEIAIIKEEIKRINADETIFVFNDPDHLDRTCYNIEKDCIFVGRNVFPDTRFGSIHPRDLMSIAAVLAHEYYGHRPFRAEYLYDQLTKTVTTPIWMDECRASINASKLAPNLTIMEKSFLIQDAVKRAQEFGQQIEMDDYMRGVLYGCTETDKNIVPQLREIIFVSEESNERILQSGEARITMSQLWKFANCRDSGNVR